MTNLLLERITAEPEDASLTSLPYPEGEAPTPIVYNAAPTSPLPRADYMIVTWTSAEWQALADVMGRPKTLWLKYTENWATYEPHLTWESPAKQAGCLAEYQLVSIAGKRVLLVHSQLHLSTDDNTAPLIALIEQMIEEVQPKVVLTTGTAGGINSAKADAVLGDVFIVWNAKFNCTKKFKGEAWAQQRFTQPAPSQFDGALASGCKTPFWAQQNLLPINAAKLRPIATRDPQITYNGDVETVDYFAFADTDDSYGVVANDPLAHTEEMDDACFWLVASKMSNPPLILSIRNASDPEVPSSIGTLAQQSNWAAAIYQKYGYYTSIGSAIACWAVVVDN